MPGKERAVIELTDQQRQILDGTEQPPVVVDPITGQQYRLIRQEVYEKVKKVLTPFNRNWDNPADDGLIKR
jgi:hypothetical protein